MKKVSPISLMFLLVTLLSLCTEARSALFGKPLSLQELTDKSSLVIVGMIKDMVSSWNTERTKIFTFVKLEVEDYIKGEDDRTITIRIPGGTAEGITETHSGMPTLSLGEKVLLFVNPGHPYSDIVGAYQGKYTIVDDTILGREESANEFINRLKMMTGKSLSDSKPFLLRRDQRESVKLTLDVLPPPLITSVSPASASAGTNSIVTINGNNFGSTQGEVWFLAERNPSATLSAQITYWSDTEIKCYVPTGIVNNYFYSAGSFNDALVVYNGQISNSYPFHINFGYSGMKWPTNTVQYYVNENSNDCTGEGTAVQAASDIWNGNANFSFLYGGTTSASNYRRNDKNEVLWVSYDTHSLATATTWWDYYGNIIECDIIFNDLSYNWSTNGFPLTNQFDVQTVALHEFGHWLRLLDLYGDNDQTKVMYGFSSEGADGVKRGLTQEDIAGIQYIYGPPQQKPNLTPYQPPGWSGKIVVSKSTGTNSDDTLLYTTDPLYVDWAIANYSIDISAPFDIALYVDGVLKTSWRYDSLSAGSYIPFEDYSIGSLNIGSHAIKIVADSTEVIIESNEGDNEYAKTITIQQAPNSQYPLTVGINPAGSGSVAKNPDKLSYSSGEQVSLTATPNAGYSFDGWSGDAGGNVNPLDVTMNASKSITANFTQNPPAQYTLTVNVSPSGAGSVTKAPNKALYDSGDQVTLTATPSAGYSFFNWSGDANGNANPLILTMMGNKTVMASFSVLSTGPDLTGEWLNPLPKCKKGKCKVTLTVKVENIGDMAASSVLVRIYVSNDNTVDPSDFVGAQFLTPNIPAGYYWLPKRVKVNLLAGQYLIAVIDPENSVTETVETNNQIVYGPAR